ncbi:MAG: NADH-quinone oxidoreductase subunit A [Phycisphaerae bacterium]|nr:NADH-quinone oxidoreductase subunit A [Phycisphaerae bacterium]
MVAQVISSAVPRGDTSVQLISGLLLLGGLGFALCFGALFLGWLIRPRRHNMEKDAIYECGEPTIGSSWVQFDLRFYVVALVFIVFDVEIALFWPWAVVYGGAGVDAADLLSVKTLALFDMLFFFGVIVVGFLYLWRFGYLDWVRSTVSQQRRVPGASLAAATGEAKG